VAAVGGKALVDPGGQLHHGRERVGELEPLADLVQQVAIGAKAPPDLADHVVRAVGGRERHVPRLDQLVEVGEISEWLEVAPPPPAQDRPLGRGRALLELARRPVGAERAL
jgi:hypothetical protein